MRVAELWRYPVKSMGGERLDATLVDDRGVHADRLWAVRDLELEAVTTARRIPSLMTLSARFADGEPPADAGPGRAVPVVVTFPDGTQLHSDDPGLDARLTEHTGRRVTLVPLPARSDRAAYKGVLANQADLRGQFAVPDGEPLPDLSMFPVRKLAELARYATPPGTFADAYPLHVLTRASLQAMATAAPHADFDVRRFRPSVVVETGDAEPGLLENGWLGGELALGGSVVARPEIPTIRCSMPTRPQPGLPADPDVLRTVRDQADRCLGVYALVARGGRIAMGDAVTFTPASAPGPVGAAAGRVRDGVKRRVLKAGGTVMPKGRAAAD